MAITKKCTHHLLFKRAQIALLFFIFVCASTYAEAQNFQSTSSYLNSNSPQTVEKTTATSPQQAYKSTIYEPFSSATPSSDANTGNNGPARINGRKNTGDGWVDSGEEGRSEESPIGEPWILLAFAAMAAGVISLKQRKRSEIKD